jgi:hypothetical protein
MSVRNTVFKISRVESISDFSDASCDLRQTNQTLQKLSPGTYLSVTPKHTKLFAHIQHCRCRQLTTVDSVQLIFRK